MKRYFLQTSLCIQISDRKPCMCGACEVAGAFIMSGPSNSHLDLCFNLS